MVEPIKDMKELAPVFRRRFEAWVLEANKVLALKGLVVRVTETYRSAERQDYLYALGRNSKGQVIDAKQVVTYTQDSSHEYRIAADWVPYDPKKRVVLYDRAIYGAVYKAVPLGAFGLERYIWESPHVQLAGGQKAAAKLGIKANMPFKDLPKEAR